ncbi:glycerol kinase GlpK [bacterium]|nr:glycerol kinase GlpK [bacterium]
MMKTYLTIDQSTSATKALLYGEKGNCLDTESVGHRQIYPKPGWVEHEPEEIWSNTKKAIQSLLKRNSGWAHDIRFLSITNQRETILVFDKETGAPLYNAIVWQCRRGDPICRQLIDDGHDDLIRQKTGLKIDTYFSASKLKWLIANHKEIQNKLSSGDALVGTIDTYLIYKLTQGQTFATDHTNASRTLLYDIVSLQWDKTLCQIVDVPMQSLPTVRESNAKYGETDIDGLLNKKIPIYGVMGDSQASLFAQRCFEPGMIKSTFGTGSSVLLNIGSDFKLTDSGAMTTIAWCYGGKVTYSFEGIINYCAATISWLKNQMQLIDDPKDTATLALAVNDNGGVYLVPAFAGLSAPYWNSHAKAAIVGLSAHSTKNHIVRAALESIAYQLRDVLEMMKTDSGVGLQSIHADGGATANAFLMQFVADMAGLDLRVSHDPALSPLGAYMMGLLGSGECASFDNFVEFPRKILRFQPSMDSSKADSCYKGWKRAVQRVLD